MKKIGKYSVLGELGKGGTGVVYRAIDPVLEREVAIKKQTVEGVHKDESIQRFLREARLIAKLEHRNIVTVFELGLEEDSVYIVMELLRGEDLCARLRSRRHLSLERKLRILVEVGRGLAHAHRQGVVHRDVKPRNVFLTEGGEVKLLDFGLAHISQSTLTASGQVMGSPHYMSPEQIVGRKPDPRSDVFSLGSLFYELLSGAKPFEAPTLPEVFDRILLAEPAPLDLTPALGEELSRILSKMMKKKIDERYGSLDELLHDVMRFGRNLQRQKSDLRHEVEAKARNLRTALAESPAATPGEGASTARLLSTVERDDLSFMALVGLRDGIDIELWRLQRGVEPPSLRASRVDEAKAEAAYQDARTRFDSGDLAACLVRVSEALRLSPHHGGAGELGEKVREAVVERASYFDDESEADLDVLVAAFLAFDKGQSPPGD
ncbi:MAG TPA: serine/threonine-protein kinase, partial [Vicinamibacteria bacterium]|nr:serine/threonine-protein kinase [Vicinamibacteria bacterium]